MTLPVWPLSLPQKPLSEGFSEQLPNLVIRSPMDVGQAKVRRRATAGPSRMQMAFQMTAAQVAILRTFVDNDIQGRALPFTWSHPITDVPGQFRIIDAPTFTAIANGLAWQVAVIMEQLP